MITAPMGIITTIITLTPNITGMGMATTMPMATTCIPTCMTRTPPQIFRF